MSYCSIDEAREKLEEQFELDPVMDDDLFDSYGIVKIFKSFPELAATPINTNCYPLHEILQHQPTLELVKVTYEAYPQAVKEIDRGLGYTPLHFACQLQCSGDIICFLVEAYPEALGITSSFGQTALEVLLLESIFPIETLRFIATSFPHMMWKRCKDTTEEQEHLLPPQEQDDERDDECECMQYIDDDHLGWFNPIEELIVRNDLCDKIKVLLDAYPNKKLTLSANRTYNHNGGYGNEGACSSENKEEFRGIGSLVGGAIGSSCGRTNSVRVLDCQGCSFRANGYKALFEAIGVNPEEERKQETSSSLAVMEGIEELCITLAEKNIRLDMKGVAKALENMLGTNRSIQRLCIKISPLERDQNDRLELQQNTVKVLAPHGDEGAGFSLIGHALARGLSRNKGVKELHIKAPVYCPGDTGRVGFENLQKIIQESQSIESFYFEGIKGLVPSIMLGLRDRQDHQSRGCPRSMCPLSSLSISNCQLTSLDVQEMINVLSSDFYRHHLGTLHLHDDLGKGNQTPLIHQPKVFRDVTGLSGLREFRISIPLDLQYSLLTKDSADACSRKKEIDAQEKALRAKWLDNLVIPCLEGNSMKKLEYFELKGIRWRDQDEIDRLGQALRTSRLKSVHLDVESSLDCKLDFLSLAHALREQNRHLQDMGTFLCSEQPNDEESQKEELRYFCALNAAGRRMICDAQMNKNDFFGVLGAVSDDTVLSYGLLRDLPQLWMNMNE